MKKLYMFSNINSSTFPWVSADVNFVKKLTTLTEEEPLLQVMYTSIHVTRVTIKCEDTFSSFERENFS
jgi:hypothetical protein